MEGMVMRLKQSIILTIALFVMSMGPFGWVEAHNIEAGHATVSWKGKAWSMISEMGTEFLVAL
jgi:hypothetical protein